MGIRGRLLLGYFAVIAILIVSGAVIVERLTVAMRTSVERNAVNVAVGLMAEVDQAVRDRIQALRVFAWTNVPLMEALRDSNRAFEALGDEAAIRAEIATRDEAWREAGEPTAFMRALGGNDVSRGIRHAMALHRQGGHGLEVFAEMFVTNRYGANVGQSGRTTDYRQDDEAWWQKAWADGLWVAREVGYDDSADAHSIDIAVRVSDASDEPLGVLKAVLRVRAFEQILDGFAARTQFRHATIELLDGRGRVIHRQGDAGAFDRDLSGQRAVAVALAGKRDTAIESTPEGEMLRAFARSRGAEGYPRLGWVLVVNQPTERVYEAVHALERGTLTVGVIGLGLAIVVGVLLSQAFARITQRLAETGASLQRSEASVRALVSNVVDGIVTILPDGRIASVNPAFREIFGYGEEELVGRPIDALLPPPEDGQAGGAVERLLATREAVGRRRGGGTFPVELAIGEIADARQPRYVAVVRDVTDRHEARRELQEAKEHAEAASRSKGEFLANMSHELRTPLNAIIGYTEMVADELRERGDGELVEDLEKVHTSAHNLLGLINDILDVSKVEAGRVEVYPETFELGSFLDEVVATVQPLMEANGNEIEVDAADAPPRVHTDRTKLGQILLNLLSNAAKFTKEGRVTLRARRSRPAPGEDGEWMELAVADSGIGMASEQLDHVWEAFAQADASTTREYGGTGLGLTITHSFCELLGGDVAVESSPGEGATFTVRLPVGEPDAGA